MVTELLKNNRGVDGLNPLITPADQHVESWRDLGALESSEALSRELSELLSDIGDNLSTITQDDRDCLLGSLEALANNTNTVLNSDQQNQVADSYVGLVGNISADDDWLGNPWFVSEVCKPLSQILGPAKDPFSAMDQRGKLSQKWSEYNAAENLSTKERALVRATNSLNDNIRSNQELFLDFNDRADEDRAIERDAPGDLGPAQRELGSWHTESLGSRKSNKLNLLRDCREYIADLGKKDVKIEAFWNISEPDSRVKQIDKSLENNVVSQEFNARFTSYFGEQYSNLRDTEKYAIADELGEIIEDTVNELRGRVPNFELTAKKINNQLDEAINLDNPKKKLKPVIKFVRQINPDFSNNNPEEIRQYIGEHSDEIKAQYEQRAEKLNQAIEHVHSNYKPNATNVRFMKRDMFDLKSGNLTADCTAWNLEAGFNARTVPVWITNPAFNFAYITDGNKIVAKFGMIMAFDEDQNPQVFIDSIETNKNLSEIESEYALVSIDEGFNHIQKWSDRNGFGDLRVCTFTNSTELTSALPIIKADFDQPATFDGLRASDELITRRGSENSVKRGDIYLQSRENTEAIQEEYEAELEESGARILEKWVNDATRYISEQRTSPTNDEFMNMVRAGGEDDVIKALMAVYAPGISNRYIITMDSMMNLYQDTLRRCEDKSYLFIDDQLIDPENLDEHLELRPGNMTMYEAESNEDVELENSIRAKTNSSEGDVIEEILEESCYVDLNRAAHYLFGGHVNNDDTILYEDENPYSIKLDSKFPIFDRSSVLK